MTDPREPLELNAKVIAHVWRSHTDCTWVSTGAHVVWSCGTIHDGPIYMQPTTRDDHFAALLMTQIQADRIAARQVALLDVEHLREEAGEYDTRSTALLDWSDSETWPPELNALLERTQRDAHAEGIKAEQQHRRDVADDQADLARTCGLCSGPIDMPAPEWCPEPSSRHSPANSGVARWRQWLQQRPQPWTVR